MSQVELLRCKIQGLRLVNQFWNYIDENGVLEARDIDEWDAKKICAIIRRWTAIVDRRIILPSILSLWVPHTLYTCINIWLITTYWLPSIVGDHFSGSHFSHQLPSPTIISYPFLQLFFFWVPTDQPNICYHYVNTKYRNPITKISNIYIYVCVCVCVNHVKRKSTDTTS